ncbi:MAG: hypothetical protein KJ592_02695 [Nanoarchaeota archaeon]|nr:hypothetical protein [Nanoarchaeota archaeon]
MRGKIGSAHFEVIISFLFFVGFVFFLFTTLSPNDTTLLPGSVGLGFYGSFVEMANTNLTNVFLKADYVGGCFYVEFPDELFGYVGVDDESYVVDLDGTVVDSEFSGNELSLEGGHGGFYRVALSPEFEDGGLGGCTPFEDYEIGAIIEKEVLSYGTLEEMTVRYYDDYEGLKLDLKIPAIFEFAIVPESLPFEMEPLSGIPGSVEVSARSYVFEVLKSDGTITEEEFVLKVW